MKKQHGFTLIELLVVIAVIGILAAVVLASLGSARNKGKDKAIVSDLNSVRTQIQLYFTTNGTVGTYNLLNACPNTANAVVAANVFNTDAKVKEILTHANAQVGGTAPSATVTTTDRARCFANGTNWAVAVALNEGNGMSAWCVDASGVSKKQSLSTPYVTLPAINPTTGRCS